MIAIHLNPCDCLVRAIRGTVLLDAKSRPNLAHCIQCRGKCSELLLRLFIYLPLSDLQDQYITERPLTAPRRLK